MKKASEYRKTAGDTSALEVKYHRVLKMIHDELDVAAERGSHIVELQIPICEDDLEAFDKLFQNNGYAIKRIHRCPAWGKAETDLVNGRNIDWYDTTIYF